MGVVDPEKEEIDRAESDIEKHLKDLEEESRPTWRDRIERRAEYWSSFRKTLRSDEREEFDRLLKSVRSRSSACGMLPASDELEPALLAMLVELSSRISKLEGASKGDA